MKNVTELRTELTALYTKVRDKKMDLMAAKILVSTANSILKSTEVELEHKKFTGNKKEIDFLK